MPFPFSLLRDIKDQEDWSSAALRSTEMLPALTLDHSKECNHRREEPLDLSGKPICISRSTPGAERPGHRQGRQPSPGGRL